MRERKAGLLMTISSSIGRTVIPFLGPYCATKFAVEAYAEGLNLELAPLGIESVIVEPGAYGTEFQQNVQLPSDAARMESYGEMAKAPERMFEGVSEMLSRTGSPDPADVANAVHRIIEMPGGERPLRTVVDGITGEVITRLNDDTAKHQRALMKGFGM
jgi:short-subunit dehydrogenase